MTTRAIVAIFVAALCFPRESAAQAPPADEAKEHFERGTRAFNVQDWADAIKEYRAAYKLDPRLEYLWSVAQTMRLSGDCEGAIRSYQAFLRSSPSPQQATVAGELIAKCQAAAPAPAPAPAAPPPALKEPPPVVAAPPPAPPPVVKAAPASWYADGAGHGLFWVGAAALAAGGVVTAVGNGKMADANAATLYSGFTSGKSAAGPLQSAGVTMIITGSVLAAAGIVRFAVAAGNAPGDKPAATVSLQVFGLGGAVTGQF